MWLVPLWEIERLWSVTIILFYVELDSKGCRYGVNHYENAGLRILFTLYIFCDIVIGTKGGNNYKIKLYGTNVERPKRTVVSSFYRAWSEQKSSEHVSFVEGSL